MDVVIVNLEFPAFDLWPGNAVQARILDINNAAATQADQVMMLVQFGIETRRRTGVTRPGDQAQRHECPQDAMDGHPRDLRQLSAHRTVKLLGGWVIRAILDRFKNRAPLGGDRQAGFAVRGEKAI